MQNPLPHIVQDNLFWVTHERTLFWEEENTMIVADLHLGKTGHFRKEGIAIPQSVYKADLQRLMSQIYLFKTDRLIIVGDLTHSQNNKELDLFLKWRKDFSHLPVDLVLGNHDILQQSWYDDANITVHEKKLVHNKFAFVHEKTPEEAIEAGYNHDFTFSGHLHPGIKISGAGKQSLVFPCYYFSDYHCVLPAFSKFTGTYLIKPEKNETVFAITEKEVIKL